MASTNQALADITLQLSRLPQNKICGAYTSLSGQPDPADKGLMVKWLATQIHVGGISMADVQSAVPVQSRAMPLQNVAPPAPAFDKSRMEAIEAVLNRAANDAMTAHQKLNGVHSDVQRNASELAVLNDRIDSLKQTIEASAVDGTKVSADVARAVADAFAPFKQAVIEAGAQAVVADLSAVTVVDSRDAFDVFGVCVENAKGKPLMVDIYNAPDAPAIDPNFVWTEEILEHLLLAQNTGENLWFGGEKGTGKSETARQFAARTGRSFKRINFHKYTTADDYAGAVGLENGATVFKKGDFLTAFTSPSCVVLLDEISNADQGELAVLNGFLEPNSAVSYGGSVHRRAAGVLVFAADNTLTNGDTSGRYAGTRQMNSSLADRFARVITFEYLSPDHEAEALIRHTGCHQALATHVVAAINAARAKVQTGDIIDAPSIRSAIAFIRALEVLDVQKAWDSAVLARQPAESAAALQAIANAYLNPNDIKGWL